MKIELNIQNRHVLIILLFITAASAIGLAAAYGGDTPSTMGHSWGEMYCDKCIATSNFADNSVTSAKIVDSTITNADISPTAAIAGSKITGTVPAATNANNAENANTVDGRHATAWTTISTGCGSFTDYLGCPSGWTSYTTYTTTCGCYDSYGCTYTYSRVCYASY